MELFLESCCTSLAEVRLAQASGASRIELCEDLPVGGVTPSEGLLRAALAEATIPVNVLVRPRGGNFRFSEPEVQAMLQSIELCASAGANAVVIGALDAQGNVDVPTMQRLIAAARAGGLGVTFHRAFDECADPLQAFEAIVALGCDRLLTSGHEPDAVRGSALLAELVARSRRLASADGTRGLNVLVGGGVRPSNISALAASTGASEFHASCAFFR